MRSTLRRLEHLEHTIGKPTELSEDEQNTRSFRLIKKIEDGTAPPSDLEGCADLINLTRRQLLRLADEMQELVAAGTPPPLVGLENWAARVLQVPADEPVPEFITDALEREFEHVWRPTPIPFRTEEHLRKMSECAIAVALGTPDAAEFRGLIADGDFDGPRRLVDHNAARIVTFGLTKSPPTRWSYTTYDGQYITFPEAASTAQPATSALTGLDPMDHQRSHRSGGTLTERGLRT